MNNLQEFIQANIMPGRQRQKRHKVIFWIVVLILIISVLIVMINVPHNLSDHNPFFIGFGLVVIITGILVYLTVSPAGVKILNIRCCMPKPKKLKIVDVEIIEKKHRVEERLDIETGKKHKIDYYIVGFCVLGKRKEKEMSISNEPNRKYPAVMLNKDSYDQLVEGQTAEFVTDGKKYYAPAVMRLPFKVAKKL